MDINQFPGVSLMTISVMPDILTDILETEPIPSEKIAYLKARAKLRLHNFILKHFAIAEDGPNKLDQAQIARRLGVSRARISQQLGVPGNWTIDSVTKLAAAIGGEIDFAWIPFPVADAKDAAVNLAAQIGTGQPRASGLPTTPTGQSRAAAFLPR
jgi:predicted XRE-type DNA-binding protein